MSEVPDSPESQTGNRRRIRLKLMPLSGALRWVIFLSLLGWVGLNAHRDVPLEELKERYAFSDSRFVAVEGMQVHYRRCGKGEPILLLHDANSSLHTWSGWIDSLSKNYEVITLDLPGFGLTGPHPRGSYSTFMYVNFLEQFTKAIKLQRFHLAGNGLGAQIAWFYAAEHPNRLRRLILLNAPGFEKSQFSITSFIAKTPVLNRVLWRITPRGGVRIMLESMYADDSRVDERLLDRHFELLLRPGNRKALTDRAQVSENRPPAAMVERISVPTLILWGAEDTQISPENAYEFHRLIRGSLLRIYQNTGHRPQEENPALTVQDVGSFLVGRF
jgi:pimeloyl-ACP methyl ester carboxylesterase